MPVIPGFVVVLGLLIIHGLGFIPGTFFGVGFITRVFVTMTGRQGLASECETCQNGEYCCDGMETFHSFFSLLMEPACQRTPWTLENCASTVRYLCNLRG
jgi:hypothetical protein